MDEISLVRLALGDAAEPSAQVHAQARAKLDARMTAGSPAANRSGRRRGRVAGVTGLAAAMAAAAAVTVIVTGGGPSHGKQPVVTKAQTAAYVLQRAAAAELNTSHLISAESYVRVLGGQTSIYTYVAGQRQRIVNLPGPTPNGMSPRIDLTTTINGKTWTNTTIDYRDRVYAVITSGTTDDSRPVTIFSILPLQPNPDPAVAFSEALRQGVITVLGHRNLHGKDTILLRINPVQPKLNLPKCPDKMSAPAPAASSPSGLPSVHHCRLQRLNLPPGPLLWLDAKTYLIVQTEAFLPKMSPSAQAGGSGRQAYTHFFDTVTWQAPTAANLALLNEPVPAGFTKISEQQLAQQYTGKYS
jgi:hypothetical protein